MTDLYFSFVGKISLDVLKKSRGMYFTQLKVDDIENEDDEVTRANRGKRQ